jgi:hypothetical protein
VCRSTPRGEKIETDQTAKDQAEQPRQGVNGHEVIGVACKSRVSNSAVSRELEEWIGSQAFSAHTPPHRGGGRVSEHRAVSIARPVVCRDPIDLLFV